MKAIDVRNETFADIEARLEGDRRAVYEAMVVHGPQTTRELAASMGWDLLNVRPRVSEILSMGLALIVRKQRHEGVYRAVSLAEAREAFTLLKEGETCDQRQFRLGV